MKFLPFLVFVVVSISAARATEESSNSRQLRVKTKKRTYRGKIRPKGTPETVSDADGKVRGRRSRIDLSSLELGDEEDDVDVQLMDDEDLQTLKMRRDDTTADPFESWFGMDSETGNSLTMVKTQTIHGRSVATGTLYGKNGTIYQIRTLADGDVVAEERKQDMFDKEMPGPETDVEGDDDVDPDTIDQIDGLPSGRRNLRRLDSSSVIDIMVSTPIRQPCPSSNILLDLIVMSCPGRIHQRCHVFCCGVLVRWILHSL